MYNNRPAFIHMKFRNHEQAWRAFHILECASKSNVPFSVSWIKNSWYYKLAVKSRDRRRKSFGLDTENTTGLDTDTSTRIPEK
jgi:hypothetical protein